MRYEYLPDNLIQLIGWLVMLGATLAGFLKFIQWYFKNSRDNKLIDLEMAKHNTLTAAQVADILKKYNEVIDELEDMKKEDKNKTDAIFQTIERVEDMLKEQMQIFSNFVTVNFKK